MARILEVYGKQESTPPRPREEVVPMLVRPEPKIDVTDEEASGVPFIEIGAPSGRVMSKALQEMTAVPTIIPMPRPALKLPAEVDRPVPAATAPAYFRISFQGLPIQREQLGPIERRFAPELVAFHAPEHPVAEQYRTLASELEAQLSAEGRRTLLFSSALEGSGTTSVLLNLAITLARRPAMCVAVVDANFVRPAIAARLGLAASPGLRETLARTIPLTWALQETGLAKLQALAHGTTTSEPVLDVWPLLLDQLRQRFDWVLIDAAQWSERPDLAALTATTTATYLVLQPTDLDSELTTGLFDDVTRQGGRLRGYVLAQR